MHASLAAKRVSNPLWQTHHLSGRFAINCAVFGARGAKHAMLSCALQWPRRCGRIDFVWRRCWWSLAWFYWTDKKRFKHVQFHVVKKEPRYNNREEIKKKVHIHEVLKWKRKLAERRNERKWETIIITTKRWHQNRQPKKTKEAVVRFLLPSH